VTLAAGEAEGVSSLPLSLKAHKPNIIYLCYIYRLTGCMYIYINDHRCVSGRILAVLSSHVSTLYTRQLYPLPLSLSVCRSV